SGHSFGLNPNLIRQTIIPIDAPAATSSTGTASTSSTSTPSIITTTTGKSSSAATATSTPTPANNHTNTALAAGLGVPLALAIIGGILFMLYKLNRRRQYRISEKAAQETFHSTKATPSVVPSDSTLHSQPPVEVQGYTQWEMATDKNLPEAPANYKNVHEVPANLNARPMPELPDSRI
ncbi:MAG: hypothetical protein Q9218_007869, partial [Villophora microphyllina]